MSPEHIGIHTSQLARILLRPAKKLLERSIGLRIIRTPPHGMDFHSDIRRLTPVEKTEIILDVGANIGQSALPLARMYPHATIHSFEPSLESYMALRSAAAGFANIHSYHFGIGETKTSGFLAPADRSTLNRVVEVPTNDTTEQVRITTVADFCHENSISNVSILKIDTEGHDLKVLHGAASMLAADLIDFVQVEAGFSANNSTHVDFTEIFEFMQAYGYSLFGFYEQKHEWKERMPHLRRSDVVFVSRAVILRNAGRTPR